MEITEVRIKLNNRPTDRLKAYCTITFDEVFVVRDVKVVEGTHGLFVAMPSRKLAVPCPKCRQHNPLRARFCNSCGEKLSPRELPADSDGRARLHRDVAHPITTSFREELQTRVVETYEAENQRAQDPEYAPAALETETETETETDQDEAGGEGSEYDSLIADLRGGGRGGRDDAQPARSEGSTDRAETARPQEPREGDRGRRRGGRDRGRERAPEPARSDVPMEAPAGWEPAEAPKPITPDPAEIDAGEEPADESAFDTAPVETSAGTEAPTPPEASDEVTPDRVDLSETASDLPEPEDSSEDSTAFGAGIV